MRRVVVVLLLLTPHVFFVTSAQEGSTTSFKVGAFNSGVFACAISAPFFHFGRVDSEGTDYGTPGVVSLGRNPAESGAVYRTPVGAIDWTCRAAPPEEADITLDRLSAAEAGRGELSAVLLSQAGLLSQGKVEPTDRLEEVTVGNGRFAVDGSVVLELTVLDSETPGSPTWQLMLTLDGKGSTSRETEALLLVAALVVSPPTHSLPVASD